MLYANDSMAADQLIISTTGGALPAEGLASSTRSRSALRPGCSGCGPKGSLVGGVAANAWWIVLLAGIAAALLLAALIEFAVRRRDAALALYVARKPASGNAAAQPAARPCRSCPTSNWRRATRRVVQARRSAATGSTRSRSPAEASGSSIGDVIGHDLEAAAAMSQVRAALRAYAYEGDDAGERAHRLDRLVTTFELTQLVSVVYGVLVRSSRDGSRRLRSPTPATCRRSCRTRRRRRARSPSGTSVVIGVPARRCAPRPNAPWRRARRCCCSPTGCSRSRTSRWPRRIPQLVDVVSRPSAGRGLRGPVRAGARRRGRTRPSATTSPCSPCGFARYRRGQLPATPCRRRPASKPRASEPAGTFTAPLSRR